MSDASDSILFDRVGCAMGNDSAPPAGEPTTEWTGTMEQALRNNRGIRTASSHGVIAGE